MPLNPDGGEYYELFAITRPAFDFEICKNIEQV